MGFRGRAPGQTVSGQGPLKMNAFLHDHNLSSRQIYPEVVFAEQIFVGCLGV